MADDVIRHLSSRTRRTYSRPLVRDFQRAAALVVDGKYGAGTVGALEYYGSETPPPPFYRRRDGKTSVPYVRPEER